MVKFIKVLSAITAIIFLFLWFLLRLDIQKNAYTNKKEVVDSKAIERGWIPGILPDSAYEIYESHNIDTNQIYGSFNYLEKDESSFLNTLKREGNVFIWRDYIFEVSTKENSVIFKSRK